MVVRWVIIPGPYINSTHIVAIDSSRLKMCRLHLSGIQSKYLIFPFNNKLMFYNSLEGSLLFIYKVFMLQIKMMMWKNSYFKTRCRLADGLTGFIFNTDSEVNWWRPQLKNSETVDESTWLVLIVRLGIIPGRSTTRYELGLWGYSQRLVQSPSCKWRKRLEITSHKFRSIQ